MPYTNPVSSEFSTTRKPTECTFDNSIVDEVAGKYERNYVYKRLPANYFSKILHLIYQCSF